MSREVHVRICEGVGVRLPRATRRIITGNATGFLAQAVHPRVAPCLAARGLARSRAKPRVTPREAGFALLGTRGRTSRGTLFGPPAQQTVRRVLDPIRGSVQRHQHARTGHVRRPVPPVMRGWAQSHQPGASTRTCAHGDQQGFPRRWQWARRRPPRPSRPGRRDKSCRVAAGNHGGCFGHVTRAHGTQQDVRLVRAARVPRRRPTHIQGAAKPSAPPWEPSCAARLGRRMAHKLQGRRSLLRRWQEQDGRWAVCQQRLPPLPGWHSQPLVWRTHGGSDHAEHRVWLHPNGHAQVHSQGWTVVTPRPPPGVGKA